ncbi:hypothetical protein [Chryseobacterium sp. OV279]|uniref:hypothetical protein n=1 Tax=Chryseobacterium sp. OV279 TaxID=1500285 RepID=UPI000920DA5C|nr:hypothetical protein [Chryseobacterium sp. OV279]SHF35274.1 hypothetical protein SAMN02787100_1735 [Chryseobacterium sp. OV279]
MKKEFYLKNVIPFNPMYAYLLAIPCILLWGGVYYYFLGVNFKLSFMMIFGLLCFITMYFAMKLISADITLKFDKDHLYIIRNNNKEEKYFKSDIKGFYSYNYNTSQKRSALKLELQLNNDRKIFIDSIEGMDVSILINIVKTLQSELNFEIIEKNRFNNRFWYSTK